MITYIKFKELFEHLESDRTPEIELYFKNRKTTYMIIKYNNFVTFQRCGPKEKLNGEFKFKSLDELYNSRAVDDIILKKEWQNISDILIDLTFSVIDDKEEIKNLYGIEI